MRLASATLTHGTGLPPVTAGLTGRLGVHAAPPPSGCGAWGPATVEFPGSPPRRSSDAGSVFLSTYCVPGSVPESHGTAPAPCTTGVTPFRGKNKIKASNFKKPAVGPRPQWRKERPGLHVKSAWFQRPSVCFGRTVSLGLKCWL